MTYRVRKKAFSVKPYYPSDLKQNEEWVVVKLISSAGHSAPIVRLRNKQGKIFHNIAGNLMYEGQKIKINEHNEWDITMLGDLKNRTRIFNIENIPGDGGKFVRSGEILQRL